MYTVFKKIVWDYYHGQARDLPWRHTHDPYRILVSEVMLQQTQVSRVIIKYQEFIAAFPNFSRLAKAPLARVLKVWQGMGYNRRALYLKQTAELVIKKFNGILPSDLSALQSFPGLGPNTAGSIAAFAFNAPIVFIETNIRTVFIHHFFKNKKNIVDAAILKLVNKTLDLKNPREWYYALMDYGSYLKKEFKNPSRRSAHYQKQSTFKGSNRQVRGILLRILTLKPATMFQLVHETARPRAVILKNINQMINEGLLKKIGKHFQVA